MIYFKDAPLSPSKVDPIEIAKIQRFKDSIPSRGGICAIFEDADTFQSSLRAHLSAVVQKILTNNAEGSARSLSELEVVVDPIPPENEDLSYLDFIERYEAVMPELVKTLGEINSATSNIGCQIAKRTEEIVKLQRPLVQTQQQLVDRASIRRIIRFAGENMLTYAKILEHKVPLFSNLASTGFDELSNARRYKATSPGTLRMLRALSRDCRNCLPTLKVLVRP
jgi:hypothetical protein